MLLLLKFSLQKKRKPTAKANLRKTPSRSPGKFFKSSPKEKQKTMQGKTVTEDTAWFDCDAVFGFGPED